MTLLELINLIRKRLVLVVAMPIAFAIVAAVVCFGFMPNIYTASTSMYILAKTEDPAASISQSTLSASQLVSNDVSLLLKSDRVYNDVARELGLADLSGYSVSVSSSTTSRVITLKVEGTDPQMVSRVANAMAADVSDVAREVMEVESVNVIDAAAIPTSPSGPNRPMYIAVALLAGLFAAIAIVVLLDMLNTKVSSPEELEQLLEVPVIGRIPEVKKV